MKAKRKPRQRRVTRLDTVRDNGDVERDIRRFRDMVTPPLLGRAASAIVNAEAIGQIRADIRTMDVRVSGLINGQHDVDSRLRALESRPGFWRRIFTPAAKRRTET